MVAVVGICFLCVVSVDTVILQVSLRLCPLRT